MPQCKSSSVELKESITTVYETETLNSFLKNGLHPGGINLIERIFKTINVNTNSMVLELGCGKGRTAILLREKFGCNVNGIDLSVKMISSAYLHAKITKQDNKIDFFLADSEMLPFNDASFDTIISECSFSVLPNKNKAVSEIKRVLKPGGEFIFTDIILRGELSIALQNQLIKTIDGPLYFIPSIYGALSMEGYVVLFEGAGFQTPYCEDHSIELKKLAFKIGTKFGNWQCFLQSLSSEIDNLKSMQDNASCLNAYKGLFSKGRLGYALIKVSKPK